MEITPQQEVALLRVYERGTLWAKDRTQTTMDSAYGVGDPLTFEEFKKFAQPTFGMDGAITIHWAGMWLVIEKDGYTHS